MHALNHHRFGSIPLALRRPRRAAVLACLLMATQAWAIEPPTVADVPSLGDLSLQLGRVALARHPSGDLALGFQGTWRASPGTWSVFAASRQGGRWVTPTAANGTRNVVYTHPDASSIVSVRRLSAMVNGAGDAGIGVSFECDGLCPDMGIVPRFALSSRGGPWQPVGWWGSPWATSAWSAYALPLGGGRVSLHGEPGGAAAQCAAGAGSGCTPVSIGPLAHAAAMRSKGNQAGDAATAWLRDDTGTGTRSVVAAWTLGGSWSAPLAVATMPAGAAQAVPAVHISKDRRWVVVGLADDRDADGRPDRIRMALVAADGSRPPALVDVDTIADAVAVDDLDVAILPRADGSYRVGMASVVRPAAGGSRLSVYELAVEGGSVRVAHAPYRVTAAAGVQQCSVGLLEPEVLAASWLQDGGTALRLYRRDATGERVDVLATGRAIAASALSAEVPSGASLAWVEESSAGKRRLRVADF